MMNLHEEASRCLLCEQAPCTKACQIGDPARAIRAIRFDNEKNAWQWVKDCEEADLERAEQACIHYDQPIRIKELLRGQRSEVRGERLPSLAIRFCGIECENPFFLASSAVCTNYEMVARAFEAGWGGVFYKTICKQEIREVSPRFDAVKNGTAFAGFRNMEQLSENPYQEDFDILRRLKQNYPTKVVIASIMGQFEEEWIELAQMAEKAGCDAVSAINTIKSITMSPESAVSGKQTLSGYSGKAVKPIAQRHIFEIMNSHVYSIAHAHPFEVSGVGGIETWRDALEFIQMGCHNVQVCTAVMRYGYRIIDDMIEGMQTYMVERGIDRLEDLVGEQLPNFVLPSDLDRDTMVYPKIDREKCIGCGRCYVSCQDGGHQAITFDGDTRQPHIVGTKCVGCHLCRLVCPVGAIGLAKRINKLIK